MRRAENVWGFIGGGGAKIEYVINEAGDSHVLHPSVVKRVIITDKEEGAVFRVFDNSSFKEIEVDLGTQTLMVEIHFQGQPQSMLAQLRFVSDVDPLPPLQWISEEQVPVYQAIIAKHVEHRNKEIAQHNAEIEKEGDFITVYHDQGDSVSMQIKTQGRAAFSVDKGPRAMRSATLKDEDEVYCISSIIIVLYTCNMDSSCEKWSINRMVNEVFLKTKAHTILSKSRNHNSVAVTNQLRRWLPFCKELARKSKFFTEDECPLFVPNSLNGDLRIKWMNKHAPNIFAFVKDWLKSGEKNSAIVEAEVARPSMTMKEWLAQREKDTSSQQATTTSIIGTQQQDHEEDDTSADATKSTLGVVDLVRIQTLTSMAERDMDESQKKKMQRHFQVLSFTYHYYYDHGSLTYSHGRPSRRISSHTSVISRDWSTSSKKWVLSFSGCRAWTRVSTKICRKWMP